MAIENIGIWLALAAGLVSFLSPCVLPLVPAYLAYLSGRVGGPVLAGAGGVSTEPAAEGRAHLLLSGMAFVTGLSLVFILLFYMIRSLPFDLRTAAAPVAGVAVIVLALQTAGLLRLPVLMGDHRLMHRLPFRTGPIGGFILGLSFAFGWSPCLGPTLGAVLTSGATVGTTATGLSLMVAYCLGLGVPFVAMAGAFEYTPPVVRTLRRHQRTLNLMAAAVLLMMGLLLLTGHLFWLNQIFERVLPGWLQIPGL